MKTFSDFTSPPSDYNVIVPDGWFQLPLAPDDRDRGIVALAEQQFRGVDNAPHLKKQFMREMQKKAKSAYVVGGTELYISTLTIASLPLSSSLLISIPRADEFPACSDAHELAGHLSGGNASGSAASSGDGGGNEDGKAELGVVTLAAAGDAVRQRRKEAPDAVAQLGNSELPSTLLTYYVPIPATTRWLLLSFSTPMDPLADQMVELFDVVAGTLHWD
jgi:hypothetical protein